MRADPAAAAILAENLRRRGIAAWPWLHPDGPGVRVDGAVGAPSCGFDIRCHPHGGYLTDRDIQLGTAADPGAAADLITSLYGPPSRGR